MDVIFWTKNLWKPLDLSIQILDKKDNHLNNFIKDNY